MMLSTITEVKIARPNCSVKMTYALGFNRKILNDLSLFYWERNYQEELDDAI